MADRWYPVPDPENPSLTVRLPSVTTILDVTMSEQKRSRLAMSQADNPLTAAIRREQGTTRGTLLDGWFKNSCLRGAVLPAPSGLEKIARQLRPYLLGLVRNPPHYPDETLWSVRLGYAGRSDLVAPHVRAGGLVLYELKTSGYGPWPEAIAEAQLQAAAYFLLWPSIHPDLPLQGICTIHVTPYLFQERLILKGDRLTQLLSLWAVRLRMFGSAFSQRYE